MLTVGKGAILHDAPGFGLKGGEGN
jgi:hypothetical protein